MKISKAYSFLSGFLILFFVYHFPEFFESFWVTAVFKIGFLLIAFFLARIQGWKGLGGYGLALSNKWHASLFCGLIIGVVFYFFSILLSVKFGFEKILSIESFPAILQALPIILFMTVFPSVAEDILTRGYLYAHIKNVPPGMWAFISTSVYVLNHIWRLGDGIAVLSYLFLLGLVLAYAVLLNKSLWFAFGIHWGANVAFELSNACLKLEEKDNGTNATWMLALIWALLFLILLLMHSRKQTK
ncbi:CPBP family intramembrane metalloprotease [Panacibacter ginsenosidivorans]|uniref:CPBP family intramembrane metalloprotease n=1 Tax=Panacibacter ginsenosidivorans TaxID=1813871 RepID=A0A5B8VE02_9BACT|nr:type II CAAX endopeptidase family protein [Panacibacter ginsenosidivorans]QEC69650.1 CPBP family intramembrane metalloprotease [Panacibacter ginsenosidivorans]